jgi:hypothetical protein
MKHHPTPIPVHLPIGRTIIGARRAAWVFQGCRYAAQRLDPAVQIQAVYKDYERVGWQFLVKDRLTAIRLRLCFDAMMQGRPLPLPR